MLTRWWEAYCASLKAKHYENSTFYANCAADVITDCLSKPESSLFLCATHYSNRCIVISIPVLMLWNVRISLRLKSILIGIFSVTVVVMITAIIRVTTVTSVNEEPDYSWLYFWSNIEMTTCMRLPPPLILLVFLSFIFFSVIHNHIKNR